MWIKKLCRYSTKYVTNLFIIKLVQKQIIYFANLQCTWSAYIHLLGTEVFGL